MLKDDRPTYGLQCPCHGPRLFHTALKRDAAAITHQCTATFFRVRYEEPEKISD